MTKKDIEEKHERKLTNRQMTFARHIVEGIYSNAESARASRVLTRTGKRKSIRFVEWSGLSTCC